MAVVSARFEPNGLVVLRERYKHRVWTLPLSDAIGVLIREAQRREFYRLRGGHDG